MYIYSPKASETYELFSVPSALNRIYKRLICTCEKTQKDGWSIVYAFAENCVFKIFCKCCTQMKYRLCQ